MKYFAAPFAGILFRGVAIAVVGFLVAVLVFAILVEAKGVKAGVTSFTAFSKPFDTS